jgi:hypothetical protein
VYVGEGGEVLNYFVFLFLSSSVFTLDCWSHDDDETSFIRKDDLLFWRATKRALGDRDLLHSMKNNL